MITVGEDIPAVGTARMEFQLVYDVTQEPPAWWFPAFGLLFVVIGALMWRLRDRWTWGWHGPFRRSPRWRKGFVLFWLGFSVLWTTVASVGVFGSHSHARRVLRDGTAGVVEGRVEGFHPMPHAGHDTERFSVGGVQFAYSDYIVGPGFNHTSSHGGPIREGLLVRIHYSGPPQRATILKLEIKR